MTPSTTTATTTSSYSPELRRRAANLVELAARIERSLVMSLPEFTAYSAFDDTRATLCDRMIARNLHQLHRAADDLRTTARRFEQRADELDTAVRVAA